jgi:DNA-binding CsgD family transcriptional regulator
VGGNAGLALLEEATSVLERSPSRRSLMHAQVAYGRALRRAGQRTRATEVLLRALELADAAGAAPLVAEARDELRTLGLRPRRAARSGPSALTPSEERVARLAAEGLSTPQLANQLYVTTKTVESHLTSVYRKLDVSRRSELRDALRRKDGTPAVEVSLGDSTA